MRRNGAATELRAAVKKARQRCAREKREEKGGGRIFARPDLHHRRNLVDLWMFDHNRVEKTHERLWLNTDHPALALAQARCAAAALCGAAPTRLVLALRSKAKILVVLIVSIRLVHADVHHAFARTRTAHLGLAPALLGFSASVVRFGWDGRKREQAT